MVTAVRRSYWSDVSSFWLAGELHTLSPIYNANNHDAFKSIAIKAITTPCLCADLLCAFKKREEIIPFTKKRHVRNLQCCAKVLPGQIFRENCEMKSYNVISNLWFWFWMVHPQQTYFQQEHITYIMCIFGKSNGLAFK